MGISAYLEVMEDTSLNRILDFFVTFDGVGYSPKHIAKQTNLDLETVKKIMDRLVKESFLKRTGLKKYISNIESPKFKEFKKAYWEITNREVEKFLAEEEKLVLSQ